MGQCNSTNGADGGGGGSGGGGGGCCMSQPEIENLEMSRNDSPDPVMYDLMRKSIAATTNPSSQYYHHHGLGGGGGGTSSCGAVSGVDGAGNSSKSNSNKRGRNGPPGQHHLLYKQNNSTSTTSNNNRSNDQQTSSSSKNNNTSHQQLSNNQISNPQQSLLQNGTTNITSSSNSNHNCWLPVDIPPQCPTRLLIRRRSLRVVEEGGGTHIYAIRYPEDKTKDATGANSDESTTFATSIQRTQEQCPTPSRRRQQTTQPTTAAPTTANSNNATVNYVTSTNNTNTTTGGGGALAVPASSNSKTKTKSQNNNKIPAPVGAAATADGGDVFTAAAMNSIPRQSVVDWVTVSEEHNIYIADVGLTSSQCDYLVNTTEQACRGQYAAYTYAKQTLGCREFPILAQTSFMPVHTVVHAITQRFHPHNHNSNNNHSKKDSHNNKESSNSNKANRQSHQPILQLDDREPHIVKYDVTKKERQKLDMHTDKSEWTFLIALSNGCGVDYEGGGTYFECLDATVHIQRGHALIFPGKLRHCGQKITSGLRFLLVGFLVDKSNGNNNNNTTTSNNSGGNGGGGGSNVGSNNKSSSHKSNHNNISGSNTPPSPPGVPPMRQMYENK